MSKLPSLYCNNSVLFPRGKLSKRDKSMTIPDPAEEDLQPSDEEFDPKALAKKYVERLAQAAGSKERAAKILKALVEQLAKAGAAQESGGRTTFPKEDRAKEEEESQRYPRGVGSAETPDLPERGSDWHGTVPGVPDVPEDEPMDIGKTPQEEAAEFKQFKDKNEETKKSLAGAPRFSPGPFVPPREADFLLQYGYSPEEIKSGDYKISPWMRAEFNRQQMGVVHKSLSDLVGRLRR